MAVSARFAGYYNITKFDNVTFPNAAPTNAGDAYVRFSSCANATVVTTWLSPVFSGAPAAGKYNVNAGGTSCSSLTTIGISGASGSGACGAVGSGACTYENDPNSVIDWNP